MAGLNGIGKVALDRQDTIVLAAGTAAALLGPTSQQAALSRLRPSGWLAVPAGVALVYLLLLVGGRLQNVFIYFQF
jgi:hypothetical protein